MPNFGGPNLCEAQADTCSMPKYAPNSPEHNKQTVMNWTFSRPIRWRALSDALLAHTASINLLSFDHIRWAAVVSGALLLVMCIADTRLRSSIRHSWFETRLRHICCFLLTNDALFFHCSRSLAVLLTIFTIAYDWQLSWPKSGMHKFPLADQMRFNHLQHRCDKVGCCVCAWVRVCLLVWYSG